LLSLTLSCLNFCSSGVQTVAKSPEETDEFVLMPLSRSFIEKYKLTMEDLSQVQYFLKDSLLLDKKKEDVSKAITDDLKLEVTPTYASEMVIISEKKPGFAVRIYRKWQEEGSLLKKLENSISPNREDIVLRVCFDENDPNKFVSFQPAGTDSGEYVIQPYENESTLMYGGSKYKSRKNLEENRLLFYVSFKDTKTEPLKEHVARGLRLERK
jgi:hypothetical protein